MNLFKSLLGLGLETNSKAPEFSLIDQNGNTHRLKDYKGLRVVLYFYPKDDTPGCTAEACSFRDSLDELKSIDAVVLGVSTDKQESHKKFAQKFSLNFPILSDERKEVSKSYKVLLPLGIANRITFIIDEAATIKDKISFVDNAKYGEIVKEKLKNLDLR